MHPTKHYWPQGIFFVFLLLFSMYSCSSDDTIFTEPDTDTAMEDQVEETDDTASDNETNDNEEDTNSDLPQDTGNTDKNNCTDPAGFIFNEKEGLVLVEFEKGAFTDDWALKSTGNSHTGEGYMVWEGSQYFHAPGTGIGTFKIAITTPGTYRFIWKNAITTGTDGTEHNDTWLRFNDADDFYGKQGASIIYPGGTGKSPNPKGSSKEGWFKIYRSGSDLDFKWQARTSDHDAHDIFVKFETAGSYLMEISARSSGHAIDKFVLFNTDWSEAQATSVSTQSTISCN